MVEVLIRSGPVLCKYRLPPTDPYDISPTYHTLYICVALFNTFTCTLYTCLLTAVWLCDAMYTGVWSRKTNIMYMYILWHLQAEVTSAHLYIFSTCTMYTIKQLNLHSHTHTHKLETQSRTYKHEHTHTCKWSLFLLK